MVKNGQIKIKQFRSFFQVSELFDFYRLYYFYFLYSILKINLFACTHRIANQLCSIQIFPVHVNRRNLMIVISGVIVDALARIVADRVNGFFILTIFHLAAPILLFHRTENVEKLTEPEVLNPNMYRISREGREFFDVKAIYVFRSRYESYWHICFGNGSERDYHRSELNIVESCLTQSQSSNVFEYIKQIAGLSNLKNEETGEKLLSKKFDKISFVGSDVALAKYLNPSSLQGKRTEREYIPIFPFGCNNSQYKAVKNAMENQISVIQGPPGTGKTQTILNIIANILMQGKTVQIVSNNNSATENVYEKLSSPKYNLGFIAATLGSSKNKKLFVEHQDAAYPDFSSWKTGEDPSVLQKEIAEQSSQLKSVFDKQEKLACLRQELSQLVTEQEYFNQYVKESDVHTDSIKFKKKLSSKQWMVL